ncbi:PREDICTED: protein EARLY RESPONSIVE TO DEHYDRATION 15-like [Tarenaya hassleriana]|uniref:protein EARLY RESPONSIVE TO DEHYDRATION 15-like n=1 Tax=Tarenaya hassleriana TaxID=28532 RepID=UPI00053C59D7|nr:PREDICTED: protein EARLY RESPONSIVE TO DEHYDRATION 15-like [Tarenaya hassleriana]
MALISGRRSTLNPDAPLFIPAALQQVEDFSPEWWQLVTTSPWYHDYWISQHQGEDGFYDNGDNGNIDVVDLLPESFEFDAIDEFFDPDAAEFEFQSEGTFYHPSSDVGLVEDAGVVGYLKSLEGGSPKSGAKPAKYFEKPAKWVNPRCSPRNIHQPR